MANSSAIVAHQFDDMEQQRQTDTQGMWVFLATEIMLFGGLFLCYVRYRLAYPAVFQAASRETNFWLGTLNTAVLLTSSLTMALSVHAAHEGRKKALLGFLLLTMLLGTAFMGIKFYEYYEDYTKHLIPGLNFTFPDGGTHRVPGLNLASPGVEHNAALFFVLYFFMTGLHAIHLSIGIGIVGIMLLLSLFGRISKQHDTPIEMTGLYWHLVDIVWIFLYPLLYLAGRHG